MLKKHFLTYITKKFIKKIAFSLSVVDMFFDTNQVNNALLCQNCEGRLDEPKILPCYETICSSCEKSFQINDKHFDCVVCNQKHEMPKNGLPINKALLNILSLKTTQVSRGKLFDSLHKSLDDIQTKHNFIKLGIENSSDLIKEHCIELRSDVQLKAEEVILEVNDIRSKNIEEIDEYEKELIGSKKANSKSKSLEAFNAIVKELESFHAINTEYLMHHVVDYDMVIRLNEEANSLVKKAELEIENLKEVIFDEKFLVLGKHREKINKSILGFLKIDKIFDSQIKDVLSICEFSADQKWNLIYHASQDGFEGTNFHLKCDNKPNTLIIIKSENGNVFGGYTEQSWIGETDCVYKADPNSFIFSLINLDNNPLKIKWSRNEGIYCNKNFGPVFGGGPEIGENHDIRIEDQSNTSANSYSNLGHSYTHPDYIEGSNEAKSLLAGTYNFKVSDIEVYTKK